MLSLFHPDDFMWGPHEKECYIREFCREKGITVDNIDTLIEKLSDTKLAGVVRDQQVHFHFGVNKVGKSHDLVKESEDWKQFADGVKQFIYSATGNWNLHISKTLLKDFYSGGAAGV